MVLPEVVGEGHIAPEDVEVMPNVQSLSSEQLKELMVMVQQDLDKRYPKDGVNFLEGNTLEISGVKFEIEKITQNRMTLKILSKGVFQEKLVYTNRRGRRAIESQKRKEKK